MSEKVFYGIIAISIFFVGLAGGIVFSTQDQEVPEPIQQIDYSNRFDRLDTSMINHTVDICFQWGGQWITDQNNLLEQDFDIPLDNGLFRKGQVIMCIRQAPEVQ